MKLSTKQQKGVLQVHDAYWTEYLKGNVKAMEALLDDSYTQVGSAESEVFSNKKEAIQFLYETIDEVTGKLEMRNRDTRLKQQDGVVLVHERCDLYALDGDKWVFYTKFRATTFLQERKTGWKFIHQHSSFPDSKTEEGQNVAINKIAEENRDLREAVKRRTTELEQKNRALEIEAALEKVRSRTMAMQKSEELAETALVLYEQFKALGNIPDRMSIGIFKEETKEIELWATDQFGSQLNKRFRGFWKQSAVWTSFYKAWKSGNDSFVVDLSGQKLKTWLKFIREEIKLFVDDSNIKGRRVQQAAFFSHGMLLFTTNEPVTEEIMQLLVRFAKVFSQTYTRFLDLQKAEAQAREAQIEAAMERIRSRAIAMRSSDELLEVALEIRVQTDLLGQQDLELSVVHLYEKDAPYFESMAAMRIPGGEGEITTHKIKFPIDATPKIEQMMKNYWDGLSQYTITLNFQEREEWQQVLQTTVPELFDKRLQFDQEAIASEKKEYWNFADFSGGSLLTVTYSPPTSETKELFRRAADVFDLAYKRYKDLKKAEAQAREAQIEAALERVRSKSMAMHKSEELADLSLELVKQVQALGVATWFCAFNIYDDDPEGSLEWGSNGQGTFPKYRTPREGIFLRYYEAGQGGETLLINEIGEDECPAHYEYLCTLPGVGEQLLKMKEEGIPFPASQIDHVAFFKYGYVLFITYEPTPESHEIFIRFAKVFEQTYTRFLDLKKAEAQTREAQIENALEKVRSRTMAMQKSTELGDAANNLFLQVQALGIPAWSTGYCIWETEDMKTASCSMSSEGEFQKSFSLPTIGEGYNFYDPAIKGESFYVEELGGKALVKHYEFMRTLPMVGEILDDLLNAGLSLPTFQIFHIVFFTHGYLMFITYEPVPESHEIFKRFGNVFKQTYTRFLDLQKAEVQLREAEIEAALERVRSKTMAMHNSQDVGATVVTLFDEVQKLELDDSIRCGIGILEGTEKMETWSANATPGGEVDLVVGMLDMGIHPMLIGLKKAWKSGKKGYSYEFKDGDVRTYYSRLNKEPEYPFNADLDTLPDKVFHNSFFYSAGILFAFAENPISEEAAKVLNRFAGVFGQTYRRYLDLQKAEAQAREAIKQASVDRVRGEIASMRSTADLQRITPLVWNELTTLEIPFIRCGVFIIDESDKTVQAFLSAPDGHSLGAMRIPFDADKDTAASVAHWKKKEVYKTHWDKSQFLEFMQLMIDLGQVSNKSEYQGTEQPPESLHLHFVPFTQGMLYVGNEESLEGDQIELVQSLADSFAIAYARYEDFVKLEKAKKQVENTLEELKSTQNQLVQSEKMASLGELTAGIAHEIQNPLNFVNNFSEVSVELLEELQEEMKKGDVEEVNALIEDIQQNLDKINHHGQRADGIVKGMLQHSRAGSGEKELTDLNILADEYLRLAYHGLRAKDKTFNAIIDTHFDKGLGKVNVVPQDIGRVILNLITNAFYVVKEKGEQQPEGYEPTVTVTTKKKKDKVLLSVKDNGNGIPKKIQDKIFQPFFTTKPTGEGTGLGLSMSYDIVTKGHGGGIKVDTKNGEGTTFTISLPITNKEA